VASGRARGCRGIPAAWWADRGQGKGSSVVADQLGGGFVGLVERFGSSVGIVGRRGAVKIDSGKGLRRNRAPARGCRRARGLLSGTEETRATSMWALAALGRGRNSGTVVARRRVSARFGSSVGIVGRRGAQLGEQITD